MDKTEIDQFISRLKLSEVDSQLEIVRLLQNKSVDSSCRKLIVSVEENIVLFIDILKKSTSDELKYSLLGLLCNLSIEPEVHLCLQNEARLKLICSFLTSENKVKARRRAIGILCNLSISNESKTIIGRSDIFSNVAELLSFPSEKMQENIAKALWRLTNSHYNNQANLVERNYIVALNEFLLSSCSITAKSYINSVIHACDIFIHVNEIHIKKCLAKTGVSEVKLALWNDKDVAIKCYSGSQITEKISESMLHEANLLRRLNHENIIKFYKLIPDHYLPAMIVMEYADNGSLFNYIHSGKKITWSTRLRFAAELANGLAYLHSENIIHCDIKSLNVVLCTYPGGDKPKWCDFGFSQLRQHAINTSQVVNDVRRSTTITGTLRWMAPELFDKSSFGNSRKTDIWSFGMLLFELASLRVPFSKTNDPDIIRDWITKYSGEQVSEECETYYPFFSDIMRSCWEKIPKDRPSANEIFEKINQNNTA